MGDTEIWTPSTAGEVMTTPGVYLRVAHPETPTEGTLIRGRRIDAGGRAAAVQLAVRTLSGRTELVVVPDFPVHILTPTGGGGQLAEVDALVAVLQDLQLVGADHVRGFQSPAMAAVVDALVAIREGHTGVAARLAAPRM
jgi:hypothetical protein